MKIYYQRSGSREDIPCIEFGVEQLEAALASRGVHHSRGRMRFHTMAKSISVVVGLRSDQLLAEIPAADRNSLAPKEGFAIRKQNGVIYIIGDDDVGAMYGLLDIAETIRFGGIEAVEDKAETPFHSMRGVKFNLPYHTYGFGEIFDKNKEICMTIDFWKDYIDFLALNRYNCLSLWSMNPFEMMFRLDKYPEATPYTDAEIQRFKEVYTFIFHHAARRGIRTWIVTWNLRITPAIAKGLGLPQEVAARPLNRKDVRMRQSQEVVKDYYIESIKTLLMTYPELTGLGTSNSEELVGTVEARQQWVADTYLEAIASLDFPIPFIHRTNTSNGTVTQDVFLSKYKHPEKYISWKYSNAHMYSHPKPQFETLFNAWGSMDMSEVKVIYTVRNDDFHNLRGCDPVFIADYIRGMKDNGYAAGFYWGADGYVWAGEFQHAPCKHQNWKYGFEKHWMQFEMLGRLGYNPNLDPSIWVRKFAARYGNELGLPAYNGLCAGVRMLCAVNRLFWLHYDFEWHPESCLSGRGFKTVLDFMDNDAMPLVGTISMKRWIAAKLNGCTLGGETPEDILSVLKQELRRMDESVDTMQPLIDIGADAGDIDCTLLDIKAWRALGNYYLRKFTAAMLLIEYRMTGREELQAKAVEALTEGLVHWKELAYIGSLHYLPYMMGRVGLTFGWSYYIDEVERDILLARQVIPDALASV
jgi:hypothetical protein